MDAAPSACPEKHPEQRGTSMLDTAFASPVPVIVGMGFPLEIHSVLDAIRYLDEQPAMWRDEAFDAAYEVCRDALNGTADVSEARDVLCALARRRGVLVDETWPHLPVIADGSSLRA
jgi:hypothetical protein